MNRSTHYQKHADIRERDLEFLLKRETLQKVGFIAWFENQTRSRVVEAAVRYYFLRKKGARNAYKKSKKNYKKAFSVFAPKKPKQKNKKRGKEA